MRSDDKKPAYVALLTRQYYDLLYYIQCLQKPIQYQHKQILIKMKIEQTQHSNTQNPYQIDAKFDVRINKPGPRSWTLEQHKKYLNFMKQHAQQALKLTQGQKRGRIFQQLSKIMGTRTPSQIKSRHQKLQKRYKNIYNIIAYLEALLPTLEPKSEKASVEVQCEEDPLIIPLYMQGQLDNFSEYKSSQQQIFLFEDQGDKIQTLSYIQDIFDSYLQ